MNPYVIIGLLVAWAASLWYADDFGYERAETSVNAAWRAREVTEVTEANKEILRLTGLNLTLERSYGTAMASVSTTFQARLKNAEAQRQRDIAAVRDRTVVLRDHSATSGEGTCPGATGTADAGTTGRDGETGRQLSDEATGFLLELVNEADRNVLQLDACQAVVRADRGGVAP